MFELRIEPADIDGRFPAVVFVHTNNFFFLPGGSCHHRPTMTNGCLSPLMLKSHRADAGQRKTWRFRPFVLFLDLFLYTKPEVDNWAALCV